MYFVVIATHKKEMGKERQRLSEAFGAYVHDPTHHPDVTVHHGGPTLRESDETITGLLLVLDAPSLDAARAFVDDSPYARAGIFGESHIRAWNWLTGSPG